MVEIVAMQHDVEHHRVAMLLDEARDLELEIEGARVAQEIVELPSRVLQAELNVIEPRVAQFRDTLFVEADA